jgi:nitrogenase molybdenum-iron protein alpha/beta subunit
MRLDDLAIRPANHTMLFGAYLATHAIEDGLCMIHGSVGCKVKTEQHLSSHDWIADVHNRRRFSQLVDDDLVTGSTAQLEQEIIAWHRRRSPGVIVIVPSVPVRLQGVSLDEVARRCEAATGAHVVVVAETQVDGDLYDGVAQTLAALLRRWTWPRARAADEVAIVGYPFDRYEQDHQANVAELRKLLYALGYKARAVLSAGEPYARMRLATRARHHVLLPHAAALAPLLTERGVTPVPTPLPMGLAGTASWLAVVGQALGCPAARIRKIVDAERARLAPILEVARRRLNGARVAIFADAPRAAGLATALTEVGAQIEIMGVLYRSPGGRAEVEAFMRASGAEPPPHARWLEHPTRADLLALQSRGEADGAPLSEMTLLIGGSAERALLHEPTTPWLEMGFPCEHRHALFPSPWLGFNGTAWLWQEALRATEG